MKHVLQEGDSLSAIATRYGVTRDAIIAANPSRRRSVVSGVMFIEESELDADGINALTIPAVGAPLVVNSNGLGFKPSFVYVPNGNGAACPAGTTWDATAMKCSDGSYPVCTDDNMEWTQSAGKCVTTTGFPTANPAPGTPAVAIVPPPLGASCPTGTSYAAAIGMCVDPSSGKAVAPGCHVGHAWSKVSKTCVVVTIPTKPPTSTAPTGPTPPAPPTTTPAPPAKTSYAVPIALGIGAVAVGLTILAINPPKVKAKTKSKSSKEK